MKLKSSFSTSEEFHVKTDTCTLWFKMFKNMSIVTIHPLLVAKPIKFKSSFSIFEEIHVKTAIYIFWVQYVQKYISIINNDDNCVHFPGLEKLTHICFNTMHVHCT